MDWLTPHINRIASNAWLGFCRDDDAVTAIEYALLGTLIAAACIGAFSAFGGAVGKLYDYIATGVSAVL